MTDVESVHSPKLTREFKTNGFGLIEMMIVVAVLSVISVGTMNLISNTTKSQRGIASKGRQVEVDSEIRYLLSNKQACLNTLGSSNVTTTFTKNDLIDGNLPGIIKYSIGGLDGSGLLSFNEFRIENWQVTTAANPNRGTVDFIVKFDKVGDTNGVKTIQSRFKLAVIKNAANTAIDCYALSSNVGGESLWNVSPTVGNNIFYDSGNVGIGTNDPQSALHTVGQIRGDNEIIGSQLGPSAFGQFRSIQGNYGVIERNDGTNYYLLATNSGNQFGSWNALRPFYFNLATGDVNLGHNVNISGTTTTTNLNATNIRGRFVCTIRTATANVAGFGGNVQCLADEFVMNGGGRCFNPGSTATSEIGFLNESYPSGNGWQADCHRHDGDAGDGANMHATAYANCCKIN
jgi:prepilin-type N-terminal cleavage/methylation domain-containing protein